MFILILISLAISDIFPSPHLHPDPLNHHHHHANHNVSRRSVGFSSCPPSCSLPSCFCGLSIPGGLQPQETPQFVLLTFDDAVNDLNRDFYSKLFSPARVNPNGCGIKATFYVSHEWTDYGQVSDLYASGHEIASHTVTHAWPAGRSVDDWAKEVVGMAQLLVTHANVRSEDVRGMRAPFLKTGGDTMFNMLSNYRFIYDSSLPATASSPLWPYTLDLPIPHSCNIEPCPTKQHPGMWEIPMTYMHDESGGHCSMLDACQYREDTTEGIQRMLTRNFLRHYSAPTKAPLPLFYHAAWFRLRPHRTQALFNFLDSILELPDVYLVTSQQLLAWMAKPSPLSQVSGHPALKCTPHQAGLCRGRHKCTYGDKSMATCHPTCPPQYPWA